MKIVLAVLASLAVTSTATAQETHAHEGGLGTVRFANSCSPAAQPHFLEAAALLHSFEFAPARDGFNKALAADGACGLALWGVALSNWANPFGVAIRPAATIQAGAAAVQRARTVGAKTDRERAYVEAVAKLYEPSDAPQRARMTAYRDAMAALSANYPDDAEAASFYALALAAAAAPEDKTYADQLKAGGILEKLFAQHPAHPGLAHYIIHAYDVPALADRAVAAARRYGKIAPAAPHALHMPSHTFTRLGYWQESIDTNLLSAEAARKTGNIGEELHAYDYLEYAYLQLGQLDAAKGVVDKLPAIRQRINPAAFGGAAGPSAGAFAFAAIPARYALERGAWAEAAALEFHPSSTLYADAITWFARALGAARSKDPALVAGAQKAIDQLQAIADKLSSANEAYWAEQVHIQRLGASAWLALAQGQQERAIALMREAAQREDRTEKSAVSPGPLAPAHEMLGEMYLELKRPREAAAEFQKTIGKEPNRLRARKGADAAKTTRIPDPSSLIPNR